MTCLLVLDLLCGRNEQVHLAGEDEPVGVDAPEFQVQMMSH